MTPEQQKQWMALYQKNPAVAMQVLNQFQQQQQMAKQQQQQSLKGMGGLLGSYLKGKGAATALTEAAPEAVGSAEGMFGLPGQMMSDGTVSTQWGEALNTPLAGYAAPIAGIAYGANAAKDFVSGDKLSTTQKLAMALPTAGLSLFSDKLQSAFGLGGKSLKQKSKERSDKLVKSGVMTHFDGQRESGQVSDPSKAGVKNARGLNAYDVWGANDIYDLLGNDWLGRTTEEQRRTIAQKSTDQDLWRHTKGEARITDKDKFKQLYDEVVSGKSSAPASQPEMAFYNAKPVTRPTVQGGMTAQPQADNGVASRYGADVASQVAAAQAAGRNVGTGGAGYRWDGKNFVRG